MKIKEATQHEIAKFAKELLDLNCAFTTIMSNINIENERAIILIRDPSTSNEDRVELLKYSGFLTCLQETLRDIDLNKVLAKALENTILEEADKH